LKVCALVCKNNVNDDWFEAGTPRPKLAGAAGAACSGTAARRRDPGAAPAPPGTAGKGLVEGEARGMAPAAPLRWAPA